MSDWSLRRSGAYLLTVDPHWSVLADGIDVPDTDPEDIRQLKHLAVNQGARLLSGYHPELAGLLLIHPGSDSCPTELRARKRVHASIVPLQELIELALQVPYEVPPHFTGHLALLVGAEHTALLAVAPLGVVTLEDS